MRARRTCRCSACTGRARPLREIVLEQDVIYIGGGSMRNLLAIWRAHGLDALLAEAWERGVVLAGLSAGAMCWFEGGITRSCGPPETIAGLGLLPGSLSVHADGEPERLRPSSTRSAPARCPGGWAADDGVGLLFDGTRFARAVSSRPGAGAVRVDAVDGELVRARIEPELLGARRHPAPRRRRRRAPRAAPLAPLTAMAAGELADPPAATLSPFASSARFPGRAAPKWMRTHRLPRSVNAPYGLRYELREIGSTWRRAARGTVGSGPQSPAREGALER